MRRLTAEICVEAKSHAAEVILFETEEGKAGSSYHPDLVAGVREGDLVVGLFSVNFPFILRPHNDGSHQMINVASVSDHDWGHKFLDNRIDDIKYRGLFRDPD